MRPTNAQRFHRTRDDHSRELAEDYVEMIAALIRERGEARLTEISLRLGVSHVSAGKVIKRLCREGLVSTAPYRSIFLTEAGEALAQEAHDRHELVLRFLISIGVTPETAEIDAEGIEHHVSAETLAAMRSATR